ncbi:DUF2795 domain-containing protein [Bowmanella dokdonensis]|uniref:DUF2795 domain-containing protein n=1 Tax=Bowmanella dokdonensis TaxID=751969 RepID=A0A939DR70_9ALTE|nr:DUF2795 domain-containing protein [Bowmanella dokdonensis]MBN7826391.1 DUF2795 domain-containing protein [Bowmanella dokdonensis]
MANILENGDIYFFYRPKLDSPNPASLGEVQRFYLILMPDESQQGRLFVVGKKRLPEIKPDKAEEDERGWILLDLVGDAQAITNALHPKQYQTETRGKQEESEAIPAAAGRYQLLEKDQSSRLAYRLSQPDKLGNVQKALGILEAGSYVISVRNPDLEVPGFPDAKPNYPAKLKNQFAEERWLRITDLGLLAYEDAQMVLIGAHKDLQESDVKIKGQADLFGRLKLRREDWPCEALEKGQWSGPKGKLDNLSPASDRSKGGKAGGQQALKAPSAAGIAKALKGVKLPGDAVKLIRQARSNQAPDEIIETLKALPDREFRSMAEVEKALGEVR